MLAAGGGISHPARGETFHQAIAPRFVEGAVGGDDVLRAVQRRRRRRLHRREGAVIEIGFDPRQRADERRVADREA